MKKVILTGSTGLIGKEALLPLQHSGFEVYCLTSSNCNLFDKQTVDAYFAQVKPDYLLHFAWFTGEGYLQSDLNYQYEKASLEMLKIFHKNDGKRAVFAGTCFEYQFKDTPLKETGPLEPKTPYAKCKVSLQQKADDYCKQNGISFGWGRIFYVYGKNEGLHRITGALLNKLSHNEDMEVLYGQLLKDYMYTKDIASAFTAFLDSSVEGCVNICTGIPTSLEEYAAAFAKELHKESFLHIYYKETNQPPIIVGDNSRLTKEVGFASKYTLQQAIKEIIDL